MGWLVGEHPAFGGIGGRHDPDGYHYVGRAIDVNWPTPADEAAKIRALLPMLGNAGAGLPVAEMPKIKRAIAAGPDSPLKSIVQGSLDTNRDAAQQVVKNAFESMSGNEGMEFGNFKGPWTKIMAKIAQAKGWSLRDWRTLVQKESGGNPAARNPSSGAYGLGQFLGATATAYAKYGALSPDGSDQIRAMAQYISDRYGNPSKALQFHLANNWYREGGPVGMDTGGDPFGEHRPFETSRQFQEVNRKSGAGLGKLVKKYTAGKSAKIRKSAMKNLLKQARGIGLPKAMEKALTVHSEAAADFGEFADRAASLTDESAITEALDLEMTRRGGNFPDADQAAMVNGMLGKVGGKTQLDWLKDQLQELFNWRNAMIDAEAKIVELREKVTKAIEIAREQLERIRKTLKDNYDRKDRLEKRLKELQKHPQRNKDAIKVTKTQLRNLSDTIQTREGVRDGLIGLIGPDGALTQRRQTLNTARGDMLSNLDGQADSCEG
jgi:hypothetical protein